MSRDGFYISGLVQRMAIEQSRVKRVENKVTLGVVVLGMVLQFLKRTLPCLE